MGTPEFAVPILQRLHEQLPAAAGRFVAVATQPDRPAGRGKQVAFSPVKQLALAHDIPLLQPVSLRKDPAPVAALPALAPDLLVVAAYGLILPPKVLAIPTFGCINVHASLLPAYRGASPIAAAILDGRAETGVSIMLMDEGMDTGPVLHQVRAHRAGRHHAQLVCTAGRTGGDTGGGDAPGLAAGEVAPVAQDELPGKVTSAGSSAKRTG